jgi:1-piperideine-2-carboxylate/1-pyrroline-2-carboxylate reductase [NAD(P)H]
VTTVPTDVDVVITVTTSATPVYTDPAQSGRLIVGVGVFQPEKAEITGDTVRYNMVFVDDMASAQHEVGDIIQAKIDWNEVRLIADVVSSNINNTQTYIL